MILKFFFIALSKFLILSILSNNPTPSNVSSNYNGHVTLLTYNIHRGRDSENKNTLDKIIKFMNESNSDVMCLQEVVSFQYLKISALTKTYSCFAPNVVNPISSYGLAIYSKYPIIESNHVRLTSNDEPRGFLHAVLQVDENKILNVVNVHLGLNEYERNIQISEILNYISKLEGDTIVLGDFNQTNVYLEDLIDIAQHHNLEDNHSYSKLNVRIDYIFMTNNQVYGSHYNVLETDLSDHYPIWCKIK